MADDPDLKSLWYSAQQRDFLDRNGRCETQNAVTDKGLTVEFTALGDPDDTKNPPIGWEDARCVGVGKPVWNKSPKR